MANADKGPRRTDLRLSNGDVVVIYAGQKIVDALDEVTGQLDLYHGVRLEQVMEAAYIQGLKDGRGDAHPGRPRLGP